MIRLYEQSTYSSFSRPLRSSSVMLLQSQSRFTRFTNDLMPLSEVIGSRSSSSFIVSVRSVMRAASSAESLPSPSKSKFERIISSNTGHSNIEVPPEPVVAAACSTVTLFSTLVEPVLATIRIVPRRISSEVFSEASIERVSSWRRMLSHEVAFTKSHSSASVVTTNSASSPVDEICMVSGSMLSVIFAGVSIEPWPSSVFSHAVAIRVSATAKIDNNFLIIVYYKLVSSNTTYIVAISPRRASASVIVWIIKCEAVGSLGHLKLRAPNLDIASVVLHAHQGSCI